MIQPTEEQVLQRGRDAEALLGQPAFLEAAKRLSERITDDWRHAPTTNPERLLQLHGQVAAVDAVMALLKRDVEDAKLLSDRLERARRG
jgi:hypothetical protein